MAVDLAPVIDAAAQEWNLDPALLHSVSQVESGQNSNGPDSSAGAIGPLQVMPDTASDMGVTNPRDPVQNVYAGAKYLSGLLDKYQNPNLALAAYNAGPGRVDDYLAGKGTLPAETQAYVPKVAAVYQRMTAAAQSDDPFGSAPGDTVSMAPPDAPTIAPYQVAAADTGIASDTLPNPSAPPSSARIQAPDAAPDPFSQLLMAAKAPSQPGAAPQVPDAPSPAPAAPGSAATANPAPDPFSSLMAAAKAPAGSPPTTPSAADSPTAPAGQPPAVQAPSLASRVGGAIGSGASSLAAGVGEGFQEVAHTANNVASYVDQRVPTLAALDQSAGLDPVAAGTRYQADQQAYQQQYGNNPLASVGRVAGNLLGGAPFVLGGGELLGAAAGTAAGAAGGAGTMLGRGIQAGADMLSGTAAAPEAGTIANTAVRGTSLGLNNALLGAGYAGTASGASDDPLANQLARGAELGGALGVAAPALLGVGRGIASGALGGSISPETAALAQTARDTYGIPLQAGQISDSPFVRFLSDQLGKLPFSGASTASAGQTAAMSRAIASTFGSTASQITPDVMQAARTRLGQTFDDLASKITVKADPQMLTDLGDIESRANSALTDDRAKVVGKQIDNVLNKAAQGNGTIDGNAYQALVSKGGALDDAMNSGDPGVRNFAGQIRDSIEDAMQRQAPPDLAQQLGEARFQYKNLMTVAPLVKAAQDGNVSPLKLLQAVKSNFSDMAFSGAGPLGDLATIAQRFMKPPPDSGTATRNLILGPLGAEGLNTVLHEPLSAGTAAASTLGAAAIGRAVGGYLRSPYAANRLIDNGLAGNPVSPYANALVGNAGALGGVSFRPADPSQVNLLAPAR
jgi:hypothetical protein